MSEEPVGYGDEASKDMPAPVGTQEKRTWIQQDVFLLAYAKCGTITQAMAAVELDRGQFYRCHMDIFRSDQPSGHPSSQCAFPRTRH